MAFTDYPDGTEADKTMVAMEMAMAAWERDRPDAPTAEDMARAAEDEDMARAAEDEDNARKVRAKNAAAELALALARAKAWAENEVRVEAKAWEAKAWEAKIKADANEKSRVEAARAGMKAVDMAKAAGIKKETRASRAARKIAEAGAFWARAAENKKNKGTQACA